MANLQDKMFPTVGRLVMPDNYNMESLIYCDWCRWKSKFNGIHPEQYQEKKWTNIANIKITSTAEDKRKSAIFLEPHLTSTFEVMDAEIYDDKWIGIALMMGECYNEGDIKILREYIESKANPTKLELFKDSIEDGAADICPDCIVEVREQYPEYFKDTK